MKSIFLLISINLVCSAAAVAQLTDKKNASVFDTEYYQELGSDIASLHKLMQGTFVAYFGQDSSQWTVTGNDSVVLYSIPIGEISQHGYWLLSYEFMTSMPNDPIYTSIKQIKQTSKDSFVVLYYTTTAKFKLVEIINNPDFWKKIDFANLQATDKYTTYTKSASAHFLGLSDMYEDKECHCLRQNQYDISPHFYNVHTVFFNIKTKEKLGRQNRPNLMVRRDMSKATLSKIAEKYYVLDR